MPPEIKIILYIFFVIFLLFVKDITVYLFLCVVTPISLFRIPFKSLKSGWLPISLFLLFTFISNLLFQQGRIIYNIGPLLITKEGTDVALVRTLRVFLMIAGAKFVTATTEMELLIDSLGRILKPLERLGIPVIEFFSTMGLAVKSLPGIKDQMSVTYREKVKESEAGGFWDRMRAMSMFLMPLLIKSVQYPELFFKENKGVSNVIVSPPGADEASSKVNEVG